MASLGLAKCLDILKKVANNKYVVNNVEDVTDEVQAKRNLAISALLKKLLKLLKKSLNRNIEIDVIVWILRIWSDSTNVFANIKF